MEDNFYARMVDLMVLKTNQIKGRFYFLVKKFDPL